MGQINHICLTINFWLSIWPLCLPENSYVVCTYLTITALRKNKIRSLSSPWIWMEAITRSILWPKVAHLTLGSFSWILSCSSVIYIYSKSELLPKQVVNPPPPPLNLRALLRNSIKSTCEIYWLNRNNTILPYTTTHFPLSTESRIRLPFCVYILLSPYEPPISVQANVLLMLVS